MSSYISYDKISFTNNSSNNYLSIHRVSPLCVRVCEMYIVQIQVEVRVDNLWCQSSSSILFETGFLYHYRIQKADPWVSKDSPVSYSYKYGHRGSEAQTMYLAFTWILEFELKLPCFCG